MTVIDSVNRASTYDRRIAIARAADTRKESLLADIIADGFALSWNAILSTELPEPLDAIETRIREQMNRLTFANDITTIAINGKLLATWAQKRFEEDAGVRAPANILPVEFAEAAATPGSAIEYWRRILGLTEQQVEIVQGWLRSFDREVFAIRGRVTDALMRQVTELYSKAITGEGGLQAFLREAREVMPDASRRIFEGEYRTHMSEQYGRARHEQAISRADSFPFLQFFAVVDSRTTWDICLPMGTAGPNGTGYIAATTDSVWFTWRPPNHFGGCRSTIVPIGYRECIRMGILATDGRTKSRGNRPFGDPPEFAEDPKTGELRAVRPQEGFRG